MVHNKNWKNTMAQYDQAWKDKMQLARVEARKKGVVFGMPKGAVIRRNVEKRKAKMFAQQMVANMADDLIRAGKQLAFGNTFVYRLNATTKKSELVTDAQEIAHAFDAMRFDDSNFTFMEGTYFFATTKEPDQKSIQMLLEFAFDKPKANVPDENENAFDLKTLGRNADELRKQRAKVAEFSESKGTLLPPAENKPV